MGMMVGVIREETPKHKVLGTLAGLQCREYAAQFVAKVSSAGYPEAGTQEEFSNAAFRTLAKYIGVFTTPQNKANASGGEAIAMTAPVVMTSSEKIAMTAPVVMTSSEKIDMTAPVVMGSGSERTMSFILPSKYMDAGQAPPQPLDSRVTIEKVPARLALVSTFSGRSGPEDAKSRVQTLVQQIKAASDVSFEIDEATKEP
ncbi:unnamed protein product [Effrenium voratum]|uniref:Uncharacterized protein n=1 Tax=Effrenium voratum TaxID=2562239 RepID=A0AA36JIH6_9DINO|nr:unnamed protein product [Effrenium voratum]CAJ1434835.1 unnamed protein product [Effrenium voratum]